MFWLQYDSTPEMLVEQASRSAIPGFDNALGIVRVLFALLHFATLVSLVLGSGVTVKTDFYKPDIGSQLKTETLVLRGFERCYAFFTVWNYAAQAVYFCLAAWCSAAYAFPADVSVPPQLVLNAMHALFELSTGSAFLVTIIVGFVIWPELVREGKATGNLSTTHDFLMHNVTVFEVLTELIFGRVPIGSAHLPYGLLWGLSYVAWTWVHAPRLAGKRVKTDDVKTNGGNFMYFFLDWTLPPATLIAFLTGLVIVLLVFYLVAMGIQQLITVAPLPLWITAPAAFAAGAMLTKWRD